MPGDKEHSGLDTVHAMLLSARISALVVTGKVEAAALKTSFESETLVHVYNNTLAMQLVQCCKNQDQAAEYLRTRALPCTPVPAAAGQSTFTSSAIQKLRLCR